ncbi:MAG TPA: discoidin domain-containing protein [Actinoplanes sp.]
MTSPILESRRRRLSPARALALTASLAGLLALYFVATTTHADAAEVVVSQGKPATASSTEIANGYQPSEAVDGNNGTRWGSAWSATQWWQVDLGTPTAVSRIAINWESAYATAFQIQFSSDGTNYSQAYATTTGAGGQQSIPVTGTARYVRINLTSRALANYGYSFWEFQVFAGGTTTTPPTQPTTPPPTSGTAKLLSYNKPAHASSEQNDANCNPCTADKAFDNDPASRWATSPTTGWVDPGWIYVDLGATAQISQVVLQWDPAYAKAYQIQTSADAANWTTIYSTTTSDGFKDVINATGSGRYVRMYGTARGGPYGYSLWEFSVYGTGGNPTAPPAQPADPTFPATRMVFDDEFNGASGTGVDQSKWTIDPGAGQNGEQEYYTNGQNLTMNGSGQLAITAKKEASNGQAYTSGRMNTGGHFTFQYGRVEARIKVPKGQGFWPAFWMMGADFLTGRPWPYNGEVDIMEILGKDTYTSYSTLHAPMYNGGGGYGQSYKAAGGADLSADFHTYAAEWDSKGIRFYLDNTLVFNADRNTVENTRGAWIYDHPFYVILNLAVGGDWPGPVDATTPFPSQMLVDYVRVYQ